MIGSLKTELSYNVGSIVNGTSKGELVGIIEGGAKPELKNCFYKTATGINAIGINNGSGITTITGKTDAELKNLAATLNSLNNETVWKADKTPYKNNGYPILAWQ